MASGTWVAQNKIRPGVYININSEPRPLGALGERGTVVLPLFLDWGSQEGFIKIEAGEDPFPKLGYPIDNKTIMPVREALKRARTALIYRITTPNDAKATVTIGTDITVTAKYTGVRGNDITIVIDELADPTNGFEVTTIVGGRTEDVQYGKLVSDIQPNDWVVFSAPEDTALQTTAGAILQGGVSGTPTLQDFTPFFEALEVENFDTVAMRYDEAKDIFVSFVKRMRDVEGRKIVGVVDNYAIADYEGIISVKNGVILADGTELNAKDATAWVAGASAGALANQSLTYTAYDGAVDAFPRLSASETIQALQKGELVFSFDFDRAVVEQDINTLTSFLPTKGREFRKNRIVRTLDGINNDIVRVFGRYYIGKIDNNVEGRGLLLGEIINIVRQYEQINAVTNFDSQNDVIIERGTEVDSVHVILYVQPIDSIDKIYMSIVVRTVDPQ